MALQTFSQTFRVSASDIDHMGHVNNVAYVKWVQDVALAHWKAEATAEMQERYAWIIVWHELEYKKQAFENEEINATTWVGNWTHVTCDRYVEIKRGDDVLLNSKAVWCIVDLSTNRPCKIPKELKERFTEP